MGPINLLLMLVMPIRRGKTHMINDKTKYNKESLVSAVTGNGSINLTK